MGMGTGAGVGSFAFRFARWKHHLFAFVIRQARQDQARQASTDHGAIVICFHCVVVRKEGGGVEKSLPHKCNQQIH
jgi:hypothetical protein